MVNWVTDVPNQQTGREAPLEFRFHVAMQGVLGVGGDILHWTADELSRPACTSRRYKQIRPIVQHGGSTGWPSPATHDPCAVQYVSAGRGDVVMPYQVRGRVGAGAAGAAAWPRPEPRYRRTIRRPRPRCGARRVDGAASIGPGLPLFADAPPDPLHTADWLSEIQHWQATDG